MLCYPKNKIECVKLASKCTHMRLSVTLKWLFLTYRPYHMHICRYQCVPPNNSPYNLHIPICHAGLYLQNSKTTDFIFCEPYFIVLGPQFQLQSFFKHYILKFTLLFICWKKMASFFFSIYPSPYRILPMWRTNRSSLYR